MNMKPSVKFFSGVAGVITVVVGVAAVVATIWSFTRSEDELPTGSQERFVGLVLMAAAAAIIAAWTAAESNHLTRAATVTSASVAAGLWLSVEFGTMAGVTWAIASTAALTFAALLSTETRPAAPTKNRMRHAIAGAFVVTYLVTFALFLFFNDRRPGIGPVTSQLVDNFTDLMLLVMGFYFGGVTVEKLVELRVRGRDGVDQEAISDAAEK